MSSDSDSAYSRALSERGFALVLTIVLLAFVTLVLTALLALSRVESQVAVNSRSVALARQNAMIGLNRALAELQSTAGADLRITTSAAILDSTREENRHWTGVWSTDPDDGTEPVWLISGGLSPDTFDPQSSVLANGRVVAAGSDRVVLVGSGTIDAAVGVESDPQPDLAVVAIKVPLTVEESRVPGLDRTSLAQVPVGRIAWWVGDEGVKASLALRDRTDEIDYGPYAATELRARLRQQVPFGHQAFRPGSEAPGFDPADPLNQTRLRDVLTTSQIALLTGVSGPTLASDLRRRFHDWTPVASGVLASTHPGHRGLKRDLSLAPELLGPAVARWLDYEAYMEDFPSPSVVQPLIEDANDFRRRYRIRSASTFGSTPGEVVDGVAPVVSNVIIQFYFGRNGGDDAPIEIRARAHVELWNPYTSALVPERLHLDISGLPSVVFEVDGVISDPVSLQTLAADFSPGIDGAFRLTLPFTTGDSNPELDRVTWLPGRIHNWRTENNNGPASAPVSMRFSAKLLNLTTGWALGSVPTPASGTGALSIRGLSAMPIAVLRQDGGGRLAEYRFPEMIQSPADHEVSFGAGFASNSPAWCAGYGFRLKQPSTFGMRSTPQWLTADGGDPRGVTFLAEGLVHHDPIASSPTAPEYRGVPVTAWDAASGVPGFLLNRLTGPGAAMSYINDIPLFELPRSPVLSLGMLQHIHLAERRPFSVGNSWGSGIVAPGVSGGGSVGSWFDRFFFSGSVRAGFSGADSRGHSASLETLPYYHLQPLTENGQIPTVGQFRDASPYSSALVLLNGSFNVNSTSVDAWEAVLRAIRPGAVQAWQVGDLSDIDGGAAGSTATFQMPLIVDSTQGSSAPGNSPSGFFRFSQSIGETYESNPSGSGNMSGFNRTQYRQGLRAGDAGGGEEVNRRLDSNQIRGLATRIVEGVRSYGPFPSMESFLGPIPGSSPSESVIERAIRLEGLNTGRALMSSMYLTQADILTAIAPFLQCRSDTFLIRAYGETLNPVTQEVEARAWCEATVQRIPEKVDDSDPTTEATGFGRRFVITGFRWLSPDDV